MNAELRQQPTSDKGAPNTYEEIADDPQTSPLHDLAREPAGHESDKQDDQQALARHIHIVTSAVGRRASIAGWPGSGCMYLIMPDRTKVGRANLDQSWCVGSIAIAAYTDAYARRTDSNTRFARFIPAALDIAVARSVAIRIAPLANDDAAFTALTPATAVFVANHAYILNVAIRCDRANRKRSGRSNGSE
jgi:hypothetical protein